MKPKQQLKTKAGVEVPLYPLIAMRITQGVNGTYSHKLSMNIDDTGAPRHLDSAYAPSKLKIVKLGGTTHEVIAWSVNKVLWADGSLDYYTIRTLHDNDISDLKIGQIVEQGNPYVQEGGAGANGPTTYAIHMHINVARGHTTQLVKQTGGAYELKGSVKPQDLFFVNDTQIIDGEGYTWKTYVEPVEPVVKPVSAGLQIGSKVTITGSNYATGQAIPYWVRLRVHTIQTVKDNKALLKEIQSWVYLKDLKVA